MSSSRPRPRWFFLITPRWLAWHAFAVCAAWGMLWLGDWQFHRAEGGNALSWAYTFEWPIFTIFGVVFWAKTIIDEYRSSGDSSAGPNFRALPVLHRRGEALNLPAAAHAPEAHTADQDDEASEDPELAAYNAYLANLNRRHAAS
jgi:hypothetical protein